MSGYKRLLERVRETRFIYYTGIVLAGYCLLTWLSAGATYLFAPFDLRRFILSPVYDFAMLINLMPRDFQFTSFVFFVFLAVVIAAGLLSRQTSTELGSARWADLTEVMSKFTSSLNRPGILLGKYKGLPLVLPAGPKDNRNVAVFGPPEVGKSRAYVRPNLFHAARNNESVIVTDPKGELTNDFLKFFQSKGYETKIFNLIEFRHSDRWNPLQEIQDDIDAQVFCDVIIQSTAVPGRKKGDEFWERVETNLLKALVMYVLTEYPGKDRTMASVYDLIAIGDQKLLEAKFSTLPYSHPAVPPFNIYKSMPPNVQAGAIAGLGTRLQVFQNQMVREFTSGSDINLSLPGKKKCAYFCRLSDAESAFYFLAALFFSFLFIDLMRLADRTGGTLKVPVNFLLDEFCNIGHIPDFARKLSTMRSRGIGCSVIFQSLPQLKEHTDDWETILSDCKTWLVMGTNDNFTAEYLSKYIGDMTITTKSHTKKVGHIFDFGSDTIRSERRRVLNPDEINRYPISKAVVLIRNMQPISIDKMDFTEHPDARHLVPTNVQMYIPEWYNPKVFRIGQESKEIPESPEVLPENPVETPVQKKKRTKFWNS